MIKVSAPGSLMIAGEHAVLHHYIGIRAAINKRLQLELIPGVNKIIINSDEFGIFEYDLDNLPKDKFKFLIATINYYKKQIKQNFQVNITSDFTSNFGLGSSAAITVCFVAALNRWLGKDISNYTLYEESLNIVKTVQGFSSGMDLAASIFGHIVTMQDCNKIEVIYKKLPLLVVNCGYKTTTCDVVQFINEQLLINPLKKKLLNKITTCAHEAINAIKTDDYNKLGNIFNMQQKLMKDLNLSDELINQIIVELLYNQNILGTKISGSGLGDNLIALYDKNSFILSENLKKKGVSLLDINVGEQGLKYE